MQQSASPKGLSPCSYGARAPPQPAAPEPGPLPLCTIIMCDPLMVKQYRHYSIPSHPTHHHTWFAGVHKGRLPGLGAAKERGRGQR